MVVLVERNSSVHRRPDPKLAERPRPLEGESRIEGAAAELDVLVLEPASAELDRVGLGTAQGDREPRSNQEVARGREGDPDVTVPESVEALRPVVDVTVGRVEGFSLERAVIDSLVLDLVGKPKRQQQALVQPILGREIGAEQVEASAMLVRGDDRDRALGCDVGTGRYVRGPKAAVSGCEAQLPGAAGKKLSFGLSAGEIGVGSGGSGVGGGRDGER